MASERININEADAETLAQLTGIGSSLAARIVDYRQNVHPFEEVIELTAVPGISERMVRALEDEVTTGIPAAEAVSERVEAETMDSELPADAGATEAEAIADEEVIVAVEELPAVVDMAATDAADVEDEVEEAASDEAREEITLIVPAEDEETSGEPALALDEAESELPPAPYLSPYETVGLEQPAASSPEPAQSPSPSPAPATPSQSGAGGWRTALIGAAAGYVLALLTLLLINGGTLNFARSDDFESQTQDIDTLRSQLTINTSDVSSMAAQQAAISADLAANRQQVAELSEETGSISSSLAVLEDTSVGLQDEINSLMGDMDDMDALTSDMQERLDVVARSAETFDSFLVGLQTLLSDVRSPASGDAVTTEEGMQAAPVEELTPTPTTTPTPIPTETPGVPSPTPGGDAAYPGMPTRTPRPTTTPIPLPTTTAVP